MKHKNDKFEVQSEPAYHGILRSSNGFPKLNTMYVYRPCATRMVDIASKTLLQFLEKEKLARARRLTRMQRPFNP